MVCAEAGLFVACFVAGLAVPGAVWLVYQAGRRRGRAAACRRLSDDNIKMRAAIGELLGYFWLSCESTVAAYGDLPNIEIPISEQMAGIQEAVYVYKGN